MPARDYVAEIRTLIDKELEAPEVDIAEVVREIVGKLRANDPELLEGWLDLLAETTLRDWVRNLLSSKRHRATHRRPRSVFAEQAARLEKGESVQDTVKPWLQTKFVGAQGTQKNLGDMNREDLVAAKNIYADNARTNALRAALFAALQKKVDTGVVSDHFDNTKISRIWNSLLDA